ALFLFHKLRIFCHMLMALSAFLLLLVSRNHLSPYFFPPDPHPDTATANTIPIHIHLYLHSQAVII
uniref:Uncharacterized protein n=1 Tax=Aegilops tauschii subsp. strangulata TaxID=200361 RepID=A0A453KCY2_AEGTS